MPLSAILLDLRIPQIEEAERDPFNRASPKSDTGQRANLLRSLIRTRLAPVRKDFFAELSWRQRLVRQKRLGLLIEFDSALPELGVNPVAVTTWFKMDQFKPRHQIAVKMSETVPRSDGANIAIRQKPPRIFLGGFGHRKMSSHLVAIEVRRKTRTAERRKLKHLARLLRQRNRMERLHAVAVKRRLPVQQHDKIAMTIQEIFDLRICIRRDRSALPRPSGVALDRKFAMLAIRNGRRLILEHFVAEHFPEDIRRHSRLIPAEFRIRRYYKAKRPVHAAPETIVAQKTMLLLHPTREFRKQILHRHLNFASSRILALGSLVFMAMADNRLIIVRNITPVDGQRCGIPLYAVMHWKNRDNGYLHAFYRRIIHFHRKLDIPPIVLPGEDARIEQSALGASCLDIERWSYPQLLRRMLRTDKRKVLANAVLRIGTFELFQQVAGRQCDLTLVARVVQSMILNRFPRHLHRGTQTYFLECLV